MNNFSKALILLFVSFPGFSSAEEQLMVIGDESSLYQPTDDDFKKISRAIEYYEAKKKLIRAQTEIRDMSLGNINGSSSQGSGKANAPDVVPRNMRGIPAGDVFVDGRGNAVATAKRPTAFLAAVSGIGGNLSAELVWGDVRKVVKRGDSVIGGSWVVESVNHDDIVIGNGDRRIRISSIPVDIEQLMEAM